MLKTLRNVIKRDKNSVKIPRTVQDIFPVIRIWQNGMFQIAEDKYSFMLKIEDINYLAASADDKNALFRMFMEVINSFDCEATYKFTINNRRLNLADFENKVLLKMAGDGLDEFRQEYNDMLLDKATGANPIVQDKYITISVFKKSPEEARMFFSRVKTDLCAKLGRMGSKVSEMDVNERLRIIYDFMRAGEEAYYNFDIKDFMRKGHDFRDYVCPDSFEKGSDWFKVGDRYGRALFLKDVGSYMGDKVLTTITEGNRSMMLSMDIVPIPTEEAVREVEQRLLGEETNAANWQRKQNMNNNFSAMLPYDTDMAIRELKYTLEDINVNDQKLFLTVMTVVHTADSKKQLDIDTETIRALARDVNCGLSVLKFQQYDGMVTAIPYGHRKVDVFRTFNTQSVAIFMPFRVQEVRDNHGIYYGQNAISNNMIIIDRHELMNGNSIIGGVPGSGKSFIAKNELINIALANPNVDLFIIDPEREYGQLIRALGGEVIEISATSDNHINALDISRNYGERDPIIEKSEFIQSLCEQIISGHRFSRGQQSIIDRCTDIVLRPYIRGNYVGDNPTLKDFREELLRQPEKEAKALALELELFTTGSLDTFAKQTNVDINNRLICYDINELGEQLKAAGMLVILDSILNRITENRAKGRETYIFIDELYLLFMHQYSSQFLFKLWKRVRKYGAYCIGITQNIEDMLQSHNARTMLSNSEFVIMLNQAASDRIELAKLLNISNEQLSHITNAEPGHGLIKVGSNLVPFANDFPKNTKLYRLMSTKPGERFEGDE